MTNPKCWLSLSHDVTCPDEEELADLHATVANLTGRVTILTEALDTAHAVYDKLLADYMALKDREEKRSRAADCASCKHFMRLFEAQPCSVCNHNSRHEA